MRRLSTMRVSLSHAFCVTALAALLSFTGCANIKNDQARTKTEGTLAGTVAGGALGALVGAVIGMGSPDYIMRGALIGAGGGGVAGYAYGTSVAYKKAQYADREAYLDACIAEIDGKIAKSRAYNKQAAAIVARQERQLATLKRRNQHQNAAAPETAALSANVSTSLENLAFAEKAWEYTVQAHREAVARTRASARSLELKQRVAEMEAEKKQSHELLERFKKVKQQLPAATTIPPR